MSLPPPVAVELRPVCAADLPAIAALYRHYVDHSVATWAAPGEHVSPAAFAARWRAAAVRGLPWLALVAAADDVPTTAVPGDIHDEPPGPGAAAYAPQPALPARCALGATRLLGYAYVSEFRPRAGWAITVEDSVYLTPGWGGLGLGDRLLRALLAECAALAAAGALRSVVAAISADPRDASVGAASAALHAKHGFRLVGRLEGAGVKFGRLMDTLLLQRQLLPPAGGAHGGEPAVPGLDSLSPAGGRGESVT